MSTQLRSSPDASEPTLEAPSGTMRPWHAVATHSQPTRQPCLPVHSRRASSAPRSASTRSCEQSRTIKSRSSRCACRLVRAPKCSRRTSSAASASAASARGRTRPASKHSRPPASGSLLASGVLLRLDAPSSMVATAGVGAGAEAGSPVGWAVEEPLGAGALDMPARMEDGGFPSASNGRLTSALVLCGRRRKEEGVIGDEDLGSVG